MLNAFLLSSCILSGLFATLLIANVSDSRLGLASSLRQPSQAIAELVLSNVAATTNVDRSRKGDRLSVNDSGRVINTTIVPKAAVVLNHSIQCANATSACEIELRQCLCRLDAFRR
jgi:hypothetical protein